MKIARFLFQFVVIELSLFFIKNKAFSFTFSIQLFVLNFSLIALAKFHKFSPFHEDLFC